jgi:uncharacterized repeat protein (TIGR03803 family)
MAVAVLLGWASPAVTGQSLQPTVLYSFPCAPQSPSGNLLVASDGNIYGTTSGGGTNGGFGTLFQISTNGTVSTILSFSSTNANPYGGVLPMGTDHFYGLSANGGVGYGTVFEVVSNETGLLEPHITNWTVLTIAEFQITNSPPIGFVEGAYPYGGLALGVAGYCGTTYAGGSAGGYGTVFTGSIDQNPERVTTVVSFNKTNGANPYGGLASDRGNIYGTTVNGGVYGYGTVFEITSTGAFSPLVSFNQTNGANPTGGLLYTNSTVYGTTSNGGAYGCGTIFKVTGSTLTTLASFNNADGANPCGTLFLDGFGNLFGTTCQGGTNGGFGTVFELTSGGVLTSLFSFNSTNGAYPQGSLVQGGDGNLYGTTSSGGPNNGCGTVFRITTNGVFTSLASYNNSSGASPLAPLVQGSDGSLYGTTSIGGTNGGGGTIFQATTNGGFTSLVSFSGTNGFNPYGGLVQAGDGSLWGTTYGGGTNGGYGTVFQATTNGALTSLVSFNGSNGANPCAGLALGNDGNFYGTTHNGGTNGYGTIFQVTSNGVLTSLVSFNGTNGANPYAGLALGSDGNFYGTTFNGGTKGGGGTVFKVTTNGILSSLVSFSGAIGSSGHPYAALAQGTDGSFYGTTVAVNAIQTATVFKITTNGVLSTVLDIGANAYGTILQGADGNFYLTISGGGTYNAGTIVSISGGWITLTVPFNYADGSIPFAGLIQASDGNFNGTTAAGGANGGGTVFKLSSYPLITSQTSNQTAQCGVNAAFSASAVAMMTPFTYQWYLNSSALSNSPDISGATASTLTLSNVSLSDSGGSYTVVVSNFIGSATSQPAILTVIDILPPVITLNGPASTNIALNSVFADPGASAYDTCAGAVPVTISGVVNTGAAGTYTLSYVATDPSGNSSTNTRTVNVLAPSPVQFVPSSIAGAFTFATVSGQSYTIEQCTNLACAQWCFYTNFTGAGVPWQFIVPTNQGSSQFFQVREP